MNSTNYLNPHVLVKIRDSPGYLSFLFTERNPMEETERSLQTLIKLACNAECITSLVDGLSACLSSILTINEQGEHPVLDRLLHNLFNQMLQVIIHSIFVCRHETIWDPFEIFTSVQIWKSWHYCQLCFFP